jgi:hypothetical protein
MALKLLFKIPTIFMVVKVLIINPPLVMNKTLLLTLSILCTFYAQQSIAQITPDSSFSQDGYIIDTRGMDFFAPTTKLLELADGSVLIPGFFGDRFVLRKYDASGNMVTTFGANGEATIPALDHHLSKVCDIDITNDNKIWLLTEYVERAVQLSDSDKAYIVIMSFNEDGTINNSFNSSGYKVDQPYQDYYYHPKAMAIDKRENQTAIYVGSWAYQNGHNICSAGYGQWCISKYNTNGSRGTGFNNTGILQANANIINQAPTTAPLAIIGDLQVMQSGTLVGAGAMFNLDSSFFSFRLLSDGQWDHSFGLNGRHIHKVDFEVPTNDLSNTQVLADGSAVFYSSYRYGSDSTIVNIAKSDNAGNTINSFGPNGKITSGYRCQQYPVLIFKSDQSFLIAYYKQYGVQTDQKIEFSRYDQNGVQDISFGVGGICQTHPRNPDNYINASQVLHGIWTKDETGLYLASQNQPQGAIMPGSGLFKFKWPDLAPTSVADIDAHKIFSIYPNPLQSSNSLNVEYGQQIKSLKLYSAQGNLIDIKSLLKGRKNAIVQFPKTVSPGVYYLLINEEKGSAVIIK